jgi:hypothetical protein
LLQCGLTTSIHVRANLSVAQLAVWSILSSEGRKVQEKMYTDGFPSFALKALQVVGSTDGDAKILKLLTDACITFNGSKVNRSMVSALKLFRDIIDTKTICILRNIDQTHGRDVFSSGYVKLARLVQLCSEAAKAMGESTNKYVTYVLQYLEFELNMENLKPTEITVPWLDKNRDGTPGTVTVVLARSLLVGYVTGLIDDLRVNKMANSVVVDFDAILPAFADYILYEATFSSSKTVDALAAPQGMDEDPVESFKKKNTKTKVGELAVDFFYDLLAGVHDPKLKAALKDNPLKDLNLATIDIEPLRELGRQVNLQRAVTLGDSNQPPSAPSRTLRRYLSDGTADAENAETMKERLEAMSMMRPFLSEAMFKHTMRLRVSVSAHTTPGSTGWAVGSQRVVGLAVCLLSKGLA